MKTCGYCGQENDEQAASCAGCGTSLADGPAWSFKDTLTWSPKSDDVLIIFAVVGSLFVCQALYEILTFLAGLAYKALFLYQHSGAGGQDDTDFFLRLPGWIMWLAGAVVLGLGVVLCLVRCRKVSHALLAIGISIGIVVFVRRKAPVLQLFMPMGLFSSLTPHSVTGFCAGAALQLAFGSWFLGFFRWLRPSDVPRSTPPDLPSGPAPNADSSG